MFDLVAKAQGMTEPLQGKKRRRRSAKPRQLHSYNGEKYSIRELSEMCNIPIRTLSRRVGSGLSIYESMTKPLRQKQCKKI